MILTSEQVFQPLPPPCTQTDLSTLHPELLKETQEGRLVPPLHPPILCYHRTAVAATVFLLGKYISHFAFEQTPGKAHLLLKNSMQPSANFFSISYWTQNLELNNWARFGREQVSLKSGSRTPVPWKRKADEERGRRKREHDLGLRLWAVQGT